MIIVTFLKLFNKQTFKQLFETAFWNFQKFEKMISRFQTGIIRWILLILKRWSLNQHQYDGMDHLWLKFNFIFLFEFQQKNSQWSLSKICCFFHLLQKRLFLAFRKQFQMGPLADSKRVFNELHSHIFRIFIHATLSSCFLLEDEWQLSFHLRNFRRTSIFFQGMLVKQIHWLHLY